ncbi:MAG: hypothetical protein M3Y59_20530 [Myxococcota bacterium]|nr:hypothetical protein [Myxococcota bacterium]
MSRTVQNAISAALNSPKPARNFVTSEDAKNIAAAAKADGRVTPEEIKLVTDLNLEPTFYSDDLWEGGGKEWSFDKPTASGNGYGQISEFLRENSVKHAVDAALHQGFVGFNFVDTKDAENIVRAAKADGTIDADERQQLETLRMGWSFYPDSVQKNPEIRHETPTLSVTAGAVISAALKEKE